MQFCITNTLQVAFRDPFLIIGYMVALVDDLVEADDLLGAVPAAHRPADRVDRQTAARARPHEAQERFGDMTSLLDESLSGIKVIEGLQCDGLYHR